MKIHFKKYQLPRKLNAIFIVILLLLLLFWYLFSERDIKSLGYEGLKLVRYNYSNQWHCRFHYLNGGVQGKFTAKKNNAQLIYSSNIKSGKIIFQLYNSEDNLLFTFSANNTMDTIKGIFENGKQYRIRALATKAEGHFDFKME